ncbi:hypothetical protein TNCV_3742871 [Trichonephila clavipes]|nr:hypothetical protein TNCV_3742871 [Trichonephila clavipes]
MRAISWRGLGPLVTLHGKVKAAHYVNILGDQVHPFVQTSFPGECPLYQDDKLLSTLLKSCKNGLQSMRILGVQQTVQYGCSIVNLHQRGKEGNDFLFAECVMPSLDTSHPFHHYILNNCTLSSVVDVEELVEIYANLQSPKTPKSISDKVPYRFITNSAGFTPSTNKKQIIAILPSLVQTENGAAMLNGLLHPNDYEGRRVTRCTECYADYSFSAGY